jgi:hypothetical protein
MEQNLFLQTVLEKSKQYHNNQHFDGNILLIGCILLSIFRILDVVLI